MSKRKARFDGIEGQKQMAALSRLPKIAWPIEVERLPEKHEQEAADAVFEKVIAFRAPDDWSPTDVLMAANYAVDFALHQRCMRSLAQTGPLVRTAGGNNFKANPLYQAAQYHEQSMNKAARRLGLNAKDHIAPKTLSRRGAHFRQHHASEGLQVEGKSTRKLPKELKGLIQ